MIFLVESFSGGKEITTMTEETEYRTPNGQTTEWNAVYAKF